MSDTFMIAIVIYLLAILYARNMLNKAFKSLDSDQKLVVTEFSAGQKNWFSLIIIGLLAAFYASQSFQLINPFAAGIMFFSTVLILIIFNSLKTEKKLKALNLPQEYMRTYRTSMIIRLASYAVFIVLVL